MEDKKRFFVAQLVEWGTNNYRRFPWRETKDPFLQAIAQILLSKTPSQRVLPVFVSLVEKYPTPQALEDANYQELVETLQPLGLHKKKARYLKSLASTIHEKFGDAVPPSYSDIVSLPHLSEYGASAILCFAYDKVCPIVDTNVGRILGRFFGIQFKEPAVKCKEAWDLAGELVNECSRETVARYNYALLDFAATICKTNPDCPVCPLRLSCNFNASGESS